MFLSVRELELRKISFDKVFESGQIEFTGEDLEQGSPLHARGSAELLPAIGPPRMFRKRKRSRSTRAKRKLGFTKTAWNWRISSGSKCCWRCRCSGCAARPVKGSAPVAERTGTRPRAIVSPKWTIAGARSVTWNSEYCEALAKGSSWTKFVEVEICRIPNVDTPRGGRARAARTMP